MSSLIATRMKFVYFAQKASGGPIKIGSAANLAQRLKGLRGQFRCPLEMAASAPGRQVDEIHIHHLFAGERIVDEWFRPSPKLEALIISVAATGILPPECIYHEPPPKKFARRKFYERKVIGNPKSSETKKRQFAVIIPQRIAARAALAQRLFAGHAE